MILSPSQHRFRVHCVRKAAALIAAAALACALAGAGAAAETVSKASGSVATAAAAAGSGEPFRIAVAVSSPPWSAGSFLRETAQYMGWRSGGKAFVIEYVSAEKLSGIIERGEAEFFVCDSSLYGQFSRNGVRVLASLVSDRAPDPDRSAAAAVVVRMDSPARTLADLEGATVAAEAPGSVAGMLAVQGEAASLGRDPERFFSRVRYLGGVSGREVLEAVASGETQAGVVRAGLLEDFEEAGGRTFPELRVLPASGEEAAAHLRDRHSTAAYPGLIFGSTRGASREAIREALGILLNKPANAWGERWSVSPSFRSADALMKSLKLGPYEYERHWTLERIWNEYRPYALLAFAALLFLVLHGWLAERLVRRRTAELVRAMEVQKKNQADLALQSRQIEALERSGIVGQLSALVAHDLKHPLAAILNLAGGLSRRVEARITEGAIPIDDGLAIEERLEDIASEAKKAAEAIDHVRSHAKVGRGEGGERVPLDLARAIRGIVRDFARTRGWKPGIPVTGGESEPLLILGRQIEIELMALNLLKNACEACKNEPLPRVAVRLGRSGGADQSGTGRTDGVVNGAGGSDGSAAPRALRASSQPCVWLEVSDNGPRVGDETLEAMRRFAAPSTRKGGLGLGMGIIRSLAEANLARVSIARGEEGRGVRIRVEFPAAPRSAAPASPDVSVSARDGAPEVKKDLARKEHQA